MGIFRTPAFAEVLYLHDFWKQRDIHRRFGRLGEVVALENFLVLHQYHEMLSARNSGGDTPDGKHPYANIFAGTPACLWASLPVTF
jgi:hypothetical protein